MNSFEILQAMTNIPISYILTAGDRLGYSSASMPVDRFSSRHALRRILALAAAIMIMMAVGFTSVLAVSKDFRDMVFSFFGISQTEYTPEATSESVPVKATEPDARTLLQNLVENYMVTKEADFQSETHIDMSEFYTPTQRDALETHLSWKVFRFEKYVRLSMVEKLLWEKLSYTIYEIQINGTAANVQVAESYEYELVGANGKISSRGTELIITCEMIDGEWYISNIDTDNELIEGHVASYSADELAALAGYSE